MAADPKRAGMLSIVAALLTPSWWVLPQVLAGLGALSLLSASCLFWLEQLQPVFFTIAVGSLLYQAWMVRKRPQFLRTWGIKTIFGVSVVLNVAVIGTWVALYFRYR